MAQRRYDHEQWTRPQLREQQRQERADLAAQKTADRERKQAAIEAGKAHAEQLNQAATRTLARLASILHRGLGRPAAVVFASLLRRDQLPPLDLGSHDEPALTPVWEDYAPARMSRVPWNFDGGPVIIRRR